MPQTKFVKLYLFILPTNFTNNNNATIYRESRHKINMTFIIARETAMSYLLHLKDTKIYI